MLIVANDYRQKFVWLEKRYFDFIAADGTYLIGYDASAGLGGVNLRYQALLSSCPTFRKKRYSLGRPNDDFPNSLTFGGKVRWGGEKSHPNDLSVSSGPIDWRLDAIGFPVNVSVGDRTIEGRGYAETVCLSAAPWRLGIRTIRWGRFVGKRSWAVWNVVGGANSFEMFALNGDVTRTVSTEMDSITTGIGDMLLGNEVEPVSDGDAVKTELAAIHPFIRALAGNTFAIHQKKSVRHATLRTPDGDFEDGFAMDEYVHVAF